MDQSLRDDTAWRERAEFWAEKLREKPHNFHQKRRNRHPLILCGHGVRLSLDRGTLLVQNGFTHYPQQREEYRYFRGDPDLPSRILIVDASGSISFDVLAWLAEQQIPLIQLNWCGHVTGIANAAYTADPNLVAAQLRAHENGSSQKKFQKLIVEKFRNSISTLGILPDNRAKSEAIDFLHASVRRLSSREILSTSQLLGVEGQAATFYFAAWRDVPVKWKLSRRSIIPTDWHRVGSRRSAISKSNRNARHPVNAMLNYAYAVLYGQVRIALIAKGLDPTIGLSHAKQKYREALILDHMEPQRPIVDRIILCMILEHVFSPGDFTITGEGHCRLNPQLARVVCVRTIAHATLTMQGNSAPSSRC
jgi:CRISPR-associated protein Cas1